MSGRSSADRYTYLRTGCADRGLHHLARHLPVLIAEANRLSLASLHVPRPVK